jgi:hypothetical protein
MNERPPSVKVELVESDGDTVTVDLETAAGSLRILADVRFVGRIAYASGLHIRATIGARSVWLGIAERSRVRGARLAWRRLR